MFKNANWKKLLLDIVKLAVGFITGLLTSTPDEVQEVAQIIWNHGI